MYDAAREGQTSDLQTEIQRDAAAAMVCVVWLLVHFAFTLFQGKVPVTLPVGAGGTKDNQTPLFAACFGGHVDCVKLLLPLSNLEAASVSSSSASAPAAHRVLHYLI